MSNQLPLFEKKPNDIIVDAVKKAFPNDYESIIPVLKYDNIMGCWFFYKWGMFIGIENDGYVHS